MSAAGQNTRQEQVGQVEQMIIDCDGCQVRGLACQDCVVAVLIGPPGEVVGTLVNADPLDAEERRALGVLAQAGLVPPLRLAARADRPVTNDTPTPGRRAV